ncbi:MAG TPA: hypothetical protein VGO76_15650 [Luteibacter sp.]|nr:hypothetical protein [Luteibacter sp.]
MIANGLHTGTSLSPAVEPSPVHVGIHVDRAPDMALTGMANVGSPMSLARARERLAQAMDRDTRAVLAEKDGTDNDTPFGRTQRVSLALQRALYWLCLRFPDEALHKDLVTTTTLLVDCAKAQRLPDPAEIAQWDRCLDGMCMQSDIRDDEALRITCDVSDILRNIQARAPLVDDLETRGVWTRAGQLATMLWSYGPFDEGWQADSVKQTAREALTLIVGCKRQHELVGCLTELLHPYRRGSNKCGAMIDRFVDDLRLAETLVDDRQPMAKLGWAWVFKNDQEGFWRPWHQAECLATGMRAAVDRPGAH